MDLLGPQIRVPSAAPVTIRPQPPGMEAGRPDAVPFSAEAPPSFLLTCVADSRLRVLVCKVDLDYVFGPWLRQQIDRFGLDPDVTARRVDQEATWREPRKTAAPRPVDDSNLTAAWRSIREARSWNWSVSSFFGDDPYPFDRVDVTLSNERPLQESLNLHLLSLAGGGAVFHSGCASGGLRPVGSVTSRHFAVLLQECGAADFRRKRVRMTGFIRTQEVTGWAGMMLRVDPQRGTALEFDNMQDRPIVGTTPWRRYEIELNVPQEGQTLSFGVVLVGSGRVWLDDVTFERVGPTLPGSRARQRVRTGGGAVNLDFEKQ